MSSEALYVPGVAAALAFLFAAFATRAYLSLALRFRWVDTPNVRSAHTAATPNSGGVALVLAWFVSAGLLALLHAKLNNFVAVPHRNLVFGGLFAICAVGGWDDRRALPASVRLALFFALAAVMSCAYPPPSFDGLPAWIVIAMTTFGVAWLYNLYNFMDGIDGLAALQCVLVCVACLFLGARASAAPELLVMCALTGGAFGGFLLFNWPPARLFMGDAGSLSAGFLLSWIGLWGWYEGSLSPLLWLALMSPFILDSSVTLLRRIVSGERLTQAHSSHFYQRLARRAPRGRIPVGLAVLHIAWIWPLGAWAAYGGLSEWTMLALILFPQLLLIVKSWGLR